MMESFTPWTLFVDVGMISVLLLIGKLMRVKIKIIQKLFIPPSLLAGFMGLAFGPQGTGWLPFSDNLGTYAGILIALIFGALPLISQAEESESKDIKSMWAFSQAGMLLQWGFGGLLGLLVLGKIWDLNPGFGITMPAGYCGGHGTAAAIGQAFSQLGHSEILTLAMTAATVGIIASVIIGLLIVKWGTGKGHTSFLSDYSDLPQELRTGLLPDEKRGSMGSASCSSISIDSLTFNFIFVSMIALGGYAVSKLAKIWLPGFELPVFSCAFVVGILINWGMKKTNVSRYVCPTNISHMSGAFTDFLVAFGIASIKISVVVEYAVPLIILLSSGLLVTFAYIFVMARKMMKRHWFEKAMFTWGWYTGTMAMGIALLRVVDPGQKSRCLETYALAYLFIAPVEIALVTFAPTMFLQGWGVVFSSVSIICSAIILTLAFIKKWHL